MDETNSSPGIVPTFFAPAERASSEKLEQQRAAILLDELVDALMQSIPGYAMLINQQRQIVAINSSVLGISGSPGTEKLIGKRPGEALNCVHSGDAPGGCGTGLHCSVCGAVLAIIESQESGAQAVRECLVTLSGEDASMIDMRATATPIRIRGEKYTVFVLQDISSEKRRDVLERLFFHDVINAAGRIHGLASILVEQDGVPARLETEYKNWLARLSGNLLDEVRTQRKLLAAEKGEFVPEISEVSLRSILADVYQLYHQHGQTPGRQLVVSAGPEINLATDGSILRRIISNMTINALEATPFGGTVTISAFCRGTNAVVEVHNVGEISPEVRMQLFRRSFSTKSATGRGIGTYSMKLFGERYLNGKVSFRSSREEGTVFSFSLPLG